jgi:peptide/nickel transport system substrate-binding protein
MNDILYSLYFTIEWGTQLDKNDKTFDTEFTPRAAQSIHTIKGVNVIDEDTIEVYVDYWHFDDGEIAEWASIWSSTPWEITAAMEKAVVDGKMSFSRSGATSKNVNWLSLIIPNDANAIKNYLQKFKDSNYIPQALKENNANIDYYDNRYDSSIKWIERNNHAVISNGPFYLESYSPESRTIKVKAFDDDSYPFKKGEWEKFEKIDFPLIKKTDIKKTIQKGDDLILTIETRNSDSLLYFITNNLNEKIITDKIEIQGTKTIINIPAENMEDFETGAHSIKIFAISNSILKPDFHEMSFVLTSDKTELPVDTYENTEFSNNKYEYWIWIIPIIVIIGIITYLKKRNQSNP